MDDLLEDFRRANPLGFWVAMISAWAFVLLLVWVSVESGWTRGKMLFEAAGIPGAVTALQHDPAYRAAEAREMGGALGLIALGSGVLVFWSINRFEAKLREWRAARKRNTKKQVLHVER